FEAQALLPSAFREVRPLPSPTCRPRERTRQEAWPSVLELLRACFSCRGIVRPRRRLAGQASCAAATRYPGESSFWKSTLLAVEPKHSSPPEELSFLASGLQSPRDGKQQPFEGHLSRS